ncbi:MAG TPA: ABC transporter substrate-binding protein [Rhodocyclaceae bacterium]|nr:ABC transporter substrate-binding protein [Rhodocyclaceae bacterium]
MRSMLMVWCLAAMALMPIGASATGPNPDELIRRLSDEVLEKLRTDEALRAGESGRVVALVEQLVLPHFDFRRMTMLAVGRDWRTASPEQQDRLTEAFYRMLVRTYSGALTHYRDQTVGVQPVRTMPSDKTVRVQTEIRQPGSQPVAVDYVLAQRADGWKVFDIVVAGVSLVTSYRGTFTQALRAGGIETLIESLESKERELAQRTG